jgi:O-antigen/teichoic acid export membrane protein
MFWELWHKVAQVIIPLRAIGRRGILTLADQAVSSGSNFLTGVIIGRALSKEDFGLYLLGFSIILFVITVQNSVILSPYTVYSPRFADQEKLRYNGSALIHQLVFSWIAMISLVLVGILLSSGLGPLGLSTIVLILAQVISLILLREYIRQLCFANLRMTTALILDSFAGTIQVLGLLLLSQTGMLTIGRVYWILGVACGIPAISLIVLSWKNFTLSMPRAISDFSHNWSLGKWNLASAISSTASAELYPWFLAGFYDTAVTGGLAACRGLIFMTNPFLMGMTNYLGSKTAHAFAQGGRRGVNQIVLESSIVIFVPMAFFLMIVLFVGSKLLVFIYGSKYVGYGQVVSLFALSQLIASIAIPISCGLMAIERPDIIFKGHLLGVASTLLIGIPLVRTHGITGTAIAMVITTIITVGFRLWGFLVRSPS